jgi:hypothetical protein
MGSATRVAHPPESIDQPALSLDEAAALMSDLGFVAFRTPAEVSGTDSCLMVVIRDAPTRRHFDPEIASFWVMERGRGTKASADRATTTPLSRAYSWGPIRLEDRFGVRNEFVSFGGWLTCERVGPDATLLIFRSPAPILRLGGHSQPPDGLADNAVSFFSRLIPHTWVAAQEALIGSVPPSDLWAAFLLYERARLSQSVPLREALSDDDRGVSREVMRARAAQHDALAGGQRLLARLGLLTRGQ